MFSLVRRLWGEEVAMLHFLAAAAAASSLPVSAPAPAATTGCAAQSVQVAYLLENYPNLDNPQMAAPSTPPFGWSDEAKLQAITVSNIVDRIAEKPGDGAAILPEGSDKSRNPAILLPDCKPAPVPKRRKRLSDYPMG
jgi:hypothetical protein